MIKERHINAGALTLGVMIVSVAATGETFATSFLAMLFGAGVIFASQTLWEENQETKDFLQKETRFDPGKGARLS